MNALFMNSQWIRANRKQKAKETIYRLQIPGSDPPTYCKNSREMAEIAHNYHNDLQLNGTDINITSEMRSEQIEQILPFANRRMPSEDAIRLTGEITEDEVRKAIRKLPSGKAAGLDGIPYKLWKTLETKYERDKKEKKTGFNIVKILTRVFINVATTGVEDNTGFSDGWMCPLYKKKGPHGYRQLQTYNNT